MSLTLGEKLRQAREERGISIAEVAEQTRISPLYLQSIENDDYKPLPGGIFNKGFVKSYAKFIGIDEQEALQDYTRLLAETESRSPDELRSYRPEVLTDDRAGGSMMPTIIFAGIILALMTGGILFGVNYLQNQPETPPANIATNSANAARSDGDEAPVAEPTPNFDEIRVDFKSTTEKISVTANVDGVQRTEEVAAGATARFIAQNSLRLSYYRGFADRVEITLNGKEIRPPAAPARGVTISFDVNKENVAAIWQAGDAAATSPQAEASPAPAAPARTPARTAAPRPTRTPIVVGSSPDPRPTP